MKKQTSEIEEMKIYREVEQMLSDFKNKKIGYSTFIDEILSIVNFYLQDEKKKWKEEVMERAGRMSEWVMKTEVIEMLEKI